MEKLAADHLFWCMLDYQFSQLHWYILFMNVKRIQLQILILVDCVACRKIQYKINLFVCHRPLARLGATTEYPTSIVADFEALCRTRKNKKVSLLFKIVWVRCRVFCSLAHVCENAANLEYRTRFFYRSENFFCFVLQIGCIPTDVQGVYIEYALSANAIM